MRFLSVDNVLKHKDFLKDLKLKYSVLEKSFPIIKGLSLNDICRVRLGNAEREEITSLRSNIILHELYFDSFCEEFYPSETVRNQFGSEANFLYEIECEISKNASSEFLLVFFDRKKRLQFKADCDFSEILLSCTPVLALDLYEHSYFLDYGFDRKRYIKSALSYLNLNKINDFFKTY